MSSDTLDAINSLAACLAERDGSAIPPDALEVARRSVFDTIATMVGGSSAPGCEAGVRLARRWGGAPEATIAVYGGQVPLPSAALINGTMAQARDFDAVHERGVFHLNAALISAALAVAEWRGSVSGRELLVAVALAQDLVCRIADSLLAPLRWSRTATLGALGAAAVSARLLKLSKPRMVDSLGLGFAQAAGTLQTVADGSLAKRYLAGFAARGGVTAALLASEGVTGPHNVLEGQFGFFNVYEQGQYDRAPLLDGLGERFANVELSFKPFPCAREEHGALEAARLLAEEHGLSPEEIESATVILPPNAYAVSGRPFPLGDQVGIVHAIASAAYGVAVMLIKPGLGIADFSEEALRDPVVRDLAARIEIRRAEPDPLARNPLVPQTVNVTTKDGRVLERSVDVMKGSPARPMTDQEFTDKLRACFAVARPVIPDDARDGVERQLAVLTSLEDAGALIPSFSAGT